MEYGFDISHADVSALQCDNNLMKNCSLYGIRGTTGLRVFQDNTIRNCARAGIYWAGIIAERSGRVILSQCNIRLRHKFTDCGRLLQQHRHAAGMQSIQR